MVVSGLRAVNHAQYPRPAITLSLTDCDDKMNCGWECIEEIEEGLELVKNSYTETCASFAVRCIFYYTAILAELDGFVNNFLEIK